MGKRYDVACDVCNIAYNIHRALSSTDCQILKKVICAETGGMLGIPDTLSPVELCVYFVGYISLGFSRIMYTRC